MVTTCDVAGAVCGQNGDPMQPSSAQSIRWSPSLSMPSLQRSPLSPGTVVCVGVGVAAAVPGGVSVGVKVQVLVGVLVGDSVAVLHRPSTSA